MRGYVKTANHGQNLHYDEKITIQRRWSIRFDRLVDVPPQREALPTSKRGKAVL